MEYFEVYKKTKEIIVEYLNVDENEVQPDTNLIEALCIDSIAMVELGFRFSDTFSVPMIDGSMNLSVMQDLVAFIHEKMQ